MPQFFTGDELGNIKSLSYSTTSKASAKPTEPITLHDGSSFGKEKAIQALAIGSTSAGEKLVSAACADGTVVLHEFNEGKLNRRYEWKETRCKPGQKYVGLAISEQTVYSCTSNGALQSTSFSSLGDESLRHETASLPTRLCDWRLSADGKSFAYGGDEVELSVWDTEKAFVAPSISTSPPPSSASSKKRKRGDELLPGEIWRAKNVPNDFLSLRQPVHVTSLTYLPSSSSSHHNLLAGTMLGNVRRYDTRAGRRPVADWSSISKVGGIKVVEAGFADHEVFVADQGCNMYAMDLRNGRILYGYRGIAGAITSIAPSPSLMGSTSLDRFFRIHSTHPPPSAPEQRQEERGDVVEKIYVKSIPTVVVWDQEPESSKPEHDDDDIWEGMEDVGEESDGDDESEQKNIRKKNGL
ncbi:hypothetical protein JAAARDRAFT_152067 [Jaapia argillacea MUCL 33604]|uniref:Ribosome biogenesis protein NSA1 n=1 Tax=Jaapia argillacea MUCL 33604 TaxID=933084 RepID=A0A067Q271_9AGAM|nr:hypothetical protein JAAARDRAFT_152067 [Jaapia argillacea MUCL 33604]